MILICDCGSTKAEWVVLDGGRVEKRFVSEGFNPNICDVETITEIIRDVYKNIDNQNVTDIYFYGSGCGSEANRLRVNMLFNKIFSKAQANVFPDTLGACHALFGRNAGVACILGTGSNACAYNGESITQSIVSLGFIIGDEGSGCHIGKRIVHDYFLGIMPEDLRTKFDEKYHLDREAFLKKVYQGEQPSRYLAEFARFAAENVDNQYIKEVVSQCFEEFIYLSFRPKRNEVKCSGEILGLRKQSNDNGNGGFLDFARNDVLGFVGSVAFTFKDILTKCLENHNIKNVKILKNPMDGLIEYYKDFIA